MHMHHHQPQTQQYQPSTAPMSSGPQLRTDIFAPPTSQPPSLFANNSLFHTDSLFAQTPTPTSTTPGSTSGYGGGLFSGGGAGDASIFGQSSLFSFAPPPETPPASSVHNDPFTSFNSGYNAFAPGNAPRDATSGVGAAKKSPTGEQAGLFYSPFGGFGSSGYPDGTENS
eukprot:GFYU01005441.1.p1 GENE.GFYU01005441.1~~GFYU01005441.1.p1  ORF type:complete len:195 (-),score=54.80 GFYU01005441.1:86-595(-)